MTGALTGASATRNRGGPWLGNSGVLADALSLSEFRDKFFDWAVREGFVAVGDFSGRYRDEMHIHEFSRENVQAAYGPVVCRTCGLKLESMEQAHAIAMEQVNEMEFIESLVNDKQRISSYLYRGRDIKNDRDDIVFTAKGDLPDDRQGRIDEIHRQMKAVYRCAICEKNRPMDDSGVCKDCVPVAWAKLAEWEQKLQKD